MDSSQLTKKLVESGERQRIKQHLQTLLQQDSQWQESVKDRCQKLLKANKNITVDELLTQVLPDARQAVPSRYEQEVLAMVGQFFDKA
jgi:hypothetical protein